MNDTELKKRIEYLIQQGKTVLAKTTKQTNGLNVVPRDSYLSFRSASLSFMDTLYSTSHTYFLTFSHNVKEPTDTSIKNGLGILNSIKAEIEHGWLVSFRELLAREVFSNFMEMSEHLLNEGYHDAAAVMIGSTLEEHLRQLCQKYKLETRCLKSGDIAPKKADVLNADLKKAEVYGPIEQKLVTAWLGIRNSAAHGKYGEYTKEQVTGMYQGVLGFISQTK